MPEKFRLSLFISSFIKRDFSAVIVHESLVFFFYVDVRPLNLLFDDTFVLCVEEFLHNTQTFKKLYSFRKGLLRLAIMVWTILCFSYLTDSKMC